MGLYYTADVSWEHGHSGVITMGNGPKMKFSAPPDAYGESNVLTPEDAFVGSVNMCFTLMFIWACEKYKIDLISYSCQGVGKKDIALDKTEQFSSIVLKPEICVRKSTKNKISIALESAQKYSLIANSISGALKIEPSVNII